MFASNGVCDWCNKQSLSLLFRHDYLDGKYHHSCEECKDIAQLDVRMFNIAEKTQRESLKQA